MSKNVGEYDEMRAKLRLIEMRDAHQSIKINGKSIEIHSVKNDGIECDSLPCGTRLFNLDNSQIERLANIVGAAKAPAGSKADVYINDFGVSVKSHRGANPAFLNHTHRFGMIKVCQRLGIRIDEFDDMIDEYWDKRLKGYIKEDVSNTNPESPFKNHMDYLKPILNYFLFKGTARGESVYPATYILSFENPLNDCGWVISKDDYIETYWDKFIFSIREKGVPDTYPYCANAPFITPWVRRCDGLDKGSFHGRTEF